MKRFRLVPPFVIVTAVAFGLIIGVLQSHPVHAQSADATNGLEISPVLVELNGDNSKPYSLDIKVRNVTKSNLFFSSSVNDFGAKDETGSPSILLDSPSEPLVTSIQSWVNPIDDFSLNSGDEKIVHVTINIPPSASPGGHYGVIRFAGHEKASDKGNVGLVASAGTLVLVNVSGDVKEALDFASFEATKNNKASSFFESGPITFVSRFKNTGTTHVKPVGQIEIKNGFGKTIANLPVNESKGNVLPDSTRRFESVLEEPLLFGKYSADITIAYGTKGQALVRTFSFWVIPWKIVLVGLLLLVTIIYILRVVLIRYNRHIIMKDRKQHSSSSKKKRS